MGNPNGGVGRPMGGGGGGNLGVPMNAGGAGANSARAMSA